MMARGRGRVCRFLLVLPALLGCSGEDDGTGGTGTGVKGGGNGGAAGSTTGLGVGGRAGVGGGAGAAGASGVGAQAGSGGSSGAGGEAGGQPEAGAGGGAGVGGEAGAGGAGVPECLMPTTCPLPGACRVATCVAGVCGTAVVEDGTLVPDAFPGDCKESICQGGVPVEQAADDPPFGQTACLRGTCTGTTPGQTPQAKGAACSSATVVSGACNGAGLCVECLTDAECPGTGDSCLDNVCRPRAHVITSTPANGAVTTQPNGPFVIGFDRPMNAGSLTTQDVDGPCSGSLQLSFDDFGSCVAVASGLLANGTDVSLAPFRPIYSRTEYAVRITSAALDATLAAARAETPVKFRSAGDPAFCDSPLVIAAIVIGARGANPGTMRSDYIVLKNRSSFEVDVRGKSISLATGDAVSGLPYDPINLPSSGASITSIPPFGYYLVETATRGTAGAGLPAGVKADYSLPENGAGWSIPRGGSGRIALMESGGPALSACPSAGKIDFLQYHSAVMCSEGPGVVGLGNIDDDGGAWVRNLDGCDDTDENAKNFTYVPAAQMLAALRDTKSAPTPCTCGALSDAIAPLFVACTITSGGTLMGTEGVELPGRVKAAVSVTGHTASSTKPSVIVQAGVGPVGTNPEVQSGWTWRTATPNGVASQNSAPFEAPIACPFPAATHRYAFRVSLDGLAWQYCDLDGAGNAQPFRIEELGTLICAPQEL